ncbi:NADH:flavin oxidoreductase/NADH oxidase [Burkholderia sp. H160]|nr:NADH:flavin oxidoreductase/NADH oxidase [Burkholderia sp. H160]
MQSLESQRANYPHLFSPFRLGNLTIPNRVVMAPMSTQLADAEGSVTERQIAFYRERARGGTGMIIVEFCCVHGATGRSEHRQLILETAKQVDAHRRLVETIREAGSVACIQLQHGGPGAKRGLVKDGIATGPSDVRSRRDPDRLTCRALTNDELEELIECFGRTAELGVQAGYQAFELHAAHGYLLTTFLSPMTNHRDDAWGGDEARRLRFPTRVIERVKRAIGERPLIYRVSADEFSPDGIALEDMERIAPHLVAAGVDALHVSLGHGSTSFDKIVEPMSMPEGWRLPYARRVRAAAGVPVIAVGQIRWPETAEVAIRDGDADLVALGRPLLADPEWASKAKRGATDQIRPCTSCNYCVALSAGEYGVIGCAENPRTGRELDALPTVGGKREQRAVVIGAGPGGMAAALMLDQAGFATTLHEARPMLGGGLIASAAPPFKDKLGWYQAYLERCLATSGVGVQLNSAVDIEYLTQSRPDLVILAAGSRALAMPIEGIASPIVYDAYEVLMGDADWLPPAGSAPVLVYGGGETGCEAAEYVAERGFEVVLVTRSASKDLARSAEMIYRSVLLHRIGANPRIRVVDLTHLLAIHETDVTLQAADGTPSQLSVSRVLIAQGRRPDPTLTAQLEAAGIPFEVIGDARRGGRIGDAVHDAYAAVVARCGTTTSTSAKQSQLAC